MRIELEAPDVEMVVNGETLATFNFFELDQALTEIERNAKNTNADPLPEVRKWMIAHGMPESANESTVSIWLARYYRAMEAETKKMIGL